MTFTRTMSRAPALGVVVFALLVLRLPVVRAQQRAADPAVRGVLKAADEYVAQYESSFGAIVSEERYEQTANSRAAGNGPTKRVMRSDVLTYYNGAAGWIGFRDVIEVDGHEVGDHRTGC